MTPDKTLISIEVQIQILKQSSRSCSGTSLRQNTENPGEKTIPCSQAGTADGLCWWTGTLDRIAAQTTRKRLLYGENRIHAAAKISNLLSRTRIHSPLAVDKEAVLVSPWREQQT